MDEILATLFIIAASQGIILTLGLAFNRKKTTETRILALLTLLISIDLLIAYFYYKSAVLPEEQTIADYSLDFFGYALFFLYGPVLYFYSMRLISQIKKFKPSHSLHLVPFLLTAGYSLFLFIVSMEESDSSLTRFLYDTWENVDYFLSLLMLIFTAVYFIRTYTYLKQFSTRVKKFYSNIDSLALVWLKIFIILFLVYIFILLVFMVLLNINSDIGYIVDSHIYYIGFSLTIFVLGYFALAQPGIFDKIQLMEKGLKDEPKGEEKKDKKTKPDESTSKKYKKTKLDDVQIETYHNTLITHITKSRSFTNPEINLQKLADELDIPPHHISQVINSRLNKNFYQFINHYRVEEVKKNLAAPSMANDSILKIAFDVGFNTKSTFNAIFKQFTGMTPSQYRKNR
ncbi:MAG: AraC family transcriptional regulator [bacterium]|nr:AraC family transcriptional regulator [bacterium]